MVARQQTTDTGGGEVISVLKRLSKCSVVVSALVLAFSTACGVGNAGSLDGQTRHSSDHVTFPVKRRVIDVQDMLSLRDLGGAVDQGIRVSPDAKFVAFQMHRANLDENNYEVGWYILNLVDDGEPVHVGDAGDPLLFRAKVGNRINGAWQSTVPAWSPDSRWIAYRRMDGGSVQIWRSSVDGSAQEQLTESEASVDAFFWSNDGTRIWFETDATPKEQADYLRSKLDTGLWAGDEYFYPRSATYEIQPYELTSGQPRLWILDLSSGKTRRASEDEVDSHFMANTVSPDPVFARVNRSIQVPGRPLSRGVTAFGNGEHLAWLESQVEAILPNVQIHVRLGRADKQDIQCNAEECIGQIRQLWWSADGRAVVFSRREGPNRGRTIIYAWHIDDNTVRKIYAEDSRHLSACSSTGHSLICFSDEGARPRILVEVDFGDSSLTELFDPNPQIDQILVGEAHLIEWSNAFGLETFGWVIKPVGYENGKKYPLVIVQYRARRCFKGGTGHEYPAHLFAAEGFVVLCFDETLDRDLLESLNYTEYDHVAWKDYYAKRVILSSLESAIDLLDEKGLIDPTKVGITGLSSGANTISYALSHSSRFNAAIVAAIGWSPTTYFTAPARARAIHRKSGRGRFGTEDDKYNVSSEMSLGMNARKLHTPLLIQVSDYEAPSSMFNYVTLRESGKPVDMYVFADEYHIKWHPRNRKAVAVRAVDWMRFWLKGEQDTDPAKAEQYVRWRRMQKEQAPRTTGVTSAEK